MCQPSIGTISGLTKSHAAAVVLFVVVKFVAVVAVECAEHFFV